MLMNNDYNECQIINAVNELLDRHAQAKSEDKSYNFILIFFIVRVCGFGLCNDL